MRRFAIAVLVSSVAALAASAETVLFDFETEAECAAVPCRSANGTTVAVTNAMVPSGLHASLLSAAPRGEGSESWPAFTLKPAVTNWSGFDRLVVEVVSLRDAPQGELFLRLAGPAGDIKSGGFERSREINRHGYRQWVIPLGKWPKGVSPENVARLWFGIALWQHPNGQDVIIDRIALLKKGEPLPIPEGPCWARDILPSMRDERDSLEAAGIALAASARHVPDYFRLCAASDASPFASPAMALGWATSMEKVMPRDAFPWHPISADGLHVRLARNECESLQLLVAPKNGGLKGVKVEVAGDLDQCRMQNAECAIATATDDFTVKPSNGQTVKPRENACVFAATNVTASPMGYVNITKTVPYKVGWNTPTNAAPGYTRLTRQPEKGWWPDPILDFTNSFDIVGDDVQSVWVRVRCPEGQPSGVYTGALVVAAEGVESVRIPFSVRVNGFALGRESPLPLAVSFAAWPNKGPQSPAAMWSRHRDEWIDFLADHYITMHHLYSGGSTSVLERLKGQGRLGYYNLRYWKAPASTNEADMAKWREATIPAVRQSYETMKKLGLLDRAYLYGCDEAPKEKLPAIRRAVLELKEAAPGVPISTTAYDDEFGVRTPLDAMDWFTPLTPKYDSEKAVASRAAGHRVWWYICMTPKAPYANIFIECPAIEARLLMGAQTTKYRPDGFLYYAISIWHSKHCIESGPFTDWEPRSFTSYHGDGSWVCAGPDGVPVPTIRLENFRDGLEDYAYAKLLEEKLREIENGKLRMENDGDASSASNSSPVTRHSSLASWAQRAREALAVPREIVDSMTNYTDDPTALYRWRDEMADLIEEAEAQ